MAQSRSGDLQAHVAAVLGAHTVADVWRLFVARMRRYRFDKLLYGATRYRTHGLLGDFDDLLVLSEGPQSYLDVYLGEGLYLESAANQWASKNTGAISWLELAQGMRPEDMTPGRLRLMQLNAEHGAIAGYTISLQDRSQLGAGTIGLSPEAGIFQPECDAIWAEHGEEIEMLANLMHLKISSLPQTGQRRPLTSRQRESLEWAASGKSSQDIAVIMELSVATVEKHLRAARDALNVTTTAHAVQKATSLNLLFVEGAGEGASA